MTSEEQRATGPVEVARELAEDLSEAMNAAAYVLLTKARLSPEQSRELDVAASRIVAVLASGATIQGPPEVDFVQVRAVVTRLRASLAHSSHAGLEESCRDLVEAFRFPLPDAWPPS